MNLKRLEDTIKDLQGNEALDADQKTITGKDVCIQVLMASYPGEENLSGDKKFERFMLASKLHNGDYAFSLEEAALMKKLVGQAASVLVIGQLFPIFDGKD